MATGIAKAVLLSEVNARTSRSESDIDRVFKSILMEVSNVHPFLERRNSSYVWGISQALPDDLIRVIGIQTETATFMEPISIDQYWESMANDASVGIPTQYAVFNKTAFFYPNHTVEITRGILYVYEASDPDDNPFGAEFDECLIEGVCYKVEEGKGLLGEKPSAQAHLELYREQKAILIARYADRSW